MLFSYLYFFLETIVEMKAFETILIELAIIVFIIGWTESDSQKFESGYVQWASDCDTYGFGIAHASVNSHQCAGKCLANRRCASFTWYGNTCYLKTEIMDSVHLPLLPFKFLSGAVCGYISAQVIFHFSITSVWYIAFNLSKTTETAALVDLS